MTKKIEFYYDFISPYSYIAHKRISQIIEKKNINFEYKPILLGGLHNLAKITAPGLIKAKINYLINDCELISKKYKIKFKFNEKFPINSLSLMRGNIIIPTNKIELYTNECFNSYWVNNEDIQNLNVLKNILKKCEIDEESFFLNINNQSTKDKLKKITNDAFEKKIFGAPTFLVNNKIFWGQDRLDYAIDEYFIK